MSLNGDLEHFPLVDVIQLLHMTGKTGILSLKAPSFDNDTKAETVLCLDALDTISKKVQDLFTGLKECVPTDGSAPEAGVSHQEELVM